MVNPIKIIKGATKAITTGKAKANKKAALKSGLENRGAKPTIFERSERAKGLQWDRAERGYDAQMRATGLVSSKEGLVAARGPGKANARKTAAIRKESNLKPPVKPAKVPIKKKAGKK